RWKLVNGKELYDIPADPGEQNDVADQHRDVVAQMRRDYEEWFRDVSATRGYDPPRIALGTPFEDPVVLTRQDWRGPRAGWGKDSLGHWEVDVRSKGSYSVRLRFARAPAPSQAHLKLQAADLTQPLDQGATECTFEPVALYRGAARLEAWITRDNKPVGVSYVDVKQLD
ncbi:MAG: hypothetical protein ACE5R4_12450, partial [Armatimonadota bacterium]